jgi:hypothetical protein
MNSKDPSYIDCKFPVNTEGATKYHWYREQRKQRKQRKQSDIEEDEFIRLSVLVSVERTYKKWILYL